MEGYGVLPKEYNSHKKMPKLQTSLFSENFCVRMTEINSLLPITAVYLTLIFVHHMPEFQLTLSFKASGAVHLIGNLPPSFGLYTSIFRASPKSHIFQKTKTKPKDIFPTTLYPFFPSKQYTLIHTGRGRLSFFTVYTPLTQSSHCSLFHCPTTFLSYLSNSTTTEQNISSSKISG